jgi:hypothetical protein
VVNGQPIHSTTRVTPAMAAGITDKPMEWEDLVGIDAFEPVHNSN